MYSTKKHLINTCVCMAIAIVSGAICRAAERPGGIRVEGNEDLLQLIIAAQKTNQTLFPEGQLKAKVRGEWRSVKGGVTSFTVDAVADVVWDGKKTFWDYRLTAEWRPEEGNKSVISAQMIETDGMLYWYSAERNRAQKIADQVSGYHSELKLRPDQIWFKLGESIDWLDVLKLSAQPPKVTKFVVRQAENGNVVVERHFEGGKILRIEASFEAGGNIVAYETILRDRRGIWRKGTYEWAKDSRGRFYLRSYLYKRSVDGDPQRPDRIFSLEVLDFNPEPVIAPDRFEWASLKVPSGTFIHEKAHNRNKRYRLGQEPSKVDLQALDKFAEKLAAEGFAAPKSK